MVREAVRCRRSAFCEGNPEPVLFAWTAAKPAACDRPEPYLRPSSPMSHARAIRQSRLAVSREIPSTSAVSSTLNPLK